MARLRRWREERGTTLVETAIVLPVIMLILFGVIEYSSAYNADSVVADSVRQGGRIASTLGGDLSQTLPTPTDPTNKFVTDAVASALQQLPASAPQSLWVYEANTNGYPGALTSMSSCNTNCWRYTWNSSTESWTYDAASPGWSTSSQNVCTAPLDQVGIYVKINHDFVTGLFGANLNLDDHAVFRFEPSPEC